MSDCIIREAAEGDYADIQSLSDHCLGYDYDREKTRERLIYIMDVLGGHHKIYVAEIGGKIVGYIHACDYDLLYHDSMKNILGIAVREDARRQGVGRALLEAVERWAKDTGSAGIRLVSGARRTEAHEFYRACGYTENKFQLNLSKMFEEA